MARKKQGEEVKANMTPIIDVVFNLLIFFMVATKFKTAEGKIDSNLPRDLGMQAQPTKVEALEDVRFFLRGGKDGRPVRIQVNQNPPVEIPIPQELKKLEPKPSEEKLIEAWIEQTVPKIEALADQLRPALAADPEIKMTIDADPEVPYLFIVRAQDLARQVAREIPERDGKVEIRFSAPKPGAAKLIGIRSRGAPSQ